MHLAVDAYTHKVIVAEISLENAADNEVLPTLLNPLQRRSSLGDVKVMNKVIGLGMPVRQPTS
ncbi:hypothetical protein GCM10022394_24060 [Zobellella aerophila]|uniref:Transposase IS4-like domain-containing protein n=1 Tax=Zobellella aerophila TaxID=870480 RepID=A0ABP6W2T1_9GAMM